MKLIFAIVQPKDAKRVRNACIDAHFGVTQMSSVGGFLREGNTTFMIVSKDERVDEALKVIKEHAQARRQYLTPGNGIDNGVSSYPIDVQVGGAICFVVPVERYMEF
ncbi:cyclic-di-AMP receptor [Limosilactobacillus sp.]|uniref:cyclic-di-AMP receptor n=1 Tax=Limosilactobacillus sp. TaxID=2773925 RepID=UPI00345E15A0